jgi:hypothetical protein
MKKTHLISILAVILLPSLIAVNACSQKTEKTVVTTAETRPAVAAKDAANDPWRTYVKPSK